MISCLIIVDVFILYSIQLCVCVGSHTASSLGLNLSENPASKCVLFVKESTVKLSEQRTEF